MPTDFSAGRAELRGIYAEAQRRGWTLETIDPTNVGRLMEPFRSLLEKADGVIVRLGGALMDGVIVSLGIPVVGIDVSTALSHDLWAALTADETAIGEAAARELAATGRRTLAFVPILKAYSWTDSRRDAFLRKVRDAGLDAIAYEPHTVWNWAEERDHLARWLAELPRPFGVFAGNDFLAKLTLDACRSAGLAVPKDAAILGADDDETLCLSSSTALSSVRIDFEGAGMLAVSTLESFFDRKTKPARPKRVRYGVIGVAHRASTNAAWYAPDPRLAIALEFISLHARDPLVGVQDVADAMGASRRQADRIFASTGKSIRERIEETRLDRAMTFLRTSTMTQREIAAKCCFASETYLSRIFRRKFGRPPGKFRECRRRQAAP